MDEELWSAFQDEDKYAVFRLSHSLFEQMPDGVGVTKDWSPKGLKALMKSHVKKASQLTLEHPFYSALNEWSDAESSFYVATVVMTYPLLSDCVTHLGMMWMWDAKPPVFLLPESKKTTIFSTYQRTIPISDRYTYKTSPVTNTTSTKRIVPV